MMQTLKASLEDPDNPVLGPTLKGLHFLGMWRIGNTKLKNVFYNCVVVLEVFFVIAELINLYLSLDDLSSITENLYLTSMSIVSVLKAMAFVYQLEDWRRLTEGVAHEECLHRSSSHDQEIARKYVLHARVLGIVYAIFVVTSLLAMIALPLGTVILSPEYRIDIVNGREPYPILLDTIWYPFNDTEPPGYIFALLIEIFVSFHHCALVVVFDTHVVAIMLFFKGNLMILKNKCRTVFDGDNKQLTRKMMVERIKECHRHHNHLLALKTVFNSLLSPIMFIYVFVCAITICCCVIQLTLSSSQTSEWISMLEFITVVISQLFLYCWYSSEVTYQSNNLAQGIYEAAWWRVDVRLRTDVLLLARQLSHPFVFSAGPFTNLSINTFVEILKTSYSFYTFLTRTN